MNFIKQIERFQKLNTLIEQEKTGTPAELSTRLGVSRTKLYEMIDYLKAIGKKVAYSRPLRSFYYKDKTKVEILFSLRVIDRDEEAKKIAGGTHFFPSVLFSERNERILAGSYDRYMQEMSTAWKC